MKANQWGPDNRAPDPSPRALDLLETRGLARVHGLELDPVPDLLRLSDPVEIFRGGDIFRSQTERLETGNLAVRAASRLGSNQHLAQLGSDVIGAEVGFPSGDQVIARFFKGRFPSVDEQGSRFDRRRVQLALVGLAGTAAIAARWVRAWTPDPTIARTEASSRARARVAAPETAAVRIAVIADPFIIARSRPSSLLNSRTPPWCASKPFPGFPGKTQIILSP